MHILKNQKIYSNRMYRKNAKETLLSNDKES